MLRRSFQFILAGAAIVAFSTTHGQAKDGSAIDAKALEYKHASGIALLGDENLRLANAEPLTQPGAAQFPTYEDGWRDGCTIGLYVGSARFNGVPPKGERAGQGAEQLHTPIAGDRSAQDGEQMRTPLASELQAIDAERFGNSKEYTIGWGDGVRSCDTGAAD
jgi:hypothetical protein